MPDIENPVSEKENPISEKRLAANRANAAKSTGPRTATGKLNSSRNSLKRGFLARCVLLAEESSEAFHQLYRSLLDEFQPVTAYEHTLVETMTVARWRLLRLWHVETAGIRHEQDRQAEGNAVTGAETPPMRVMLAVRALAENSRHSDALSRYEARFDRQYHRAADRLLALRAQKNAGNERTQEVIENTGPLPENEPIEDPIEA